MYFIIYSMFNYAFGSLLVGHMSISCGGHLMFNAFKWLEGLDLLKSIDSISYHQQNVIRNAMYFITLNIYNNEYILTVSAINYACIYIYIGKIKIRIKMC